MPFFISIRPFATRRFYTNMSKGLNVSDMRVSYDQGLPLNEHEMPTDPLIPFQTWFQQAQQDVKPPYESNAMHLSTCHPTTLRPSSRVVLLKQVDEQGRFIFYTNYRSRKGQELEMNPNACIHFYWATDRYTRCVRVEGRIEQVSLHESSAYFHSRPIASQIGAWASPHQSAPIPSREFIQDLQKEMEEKYNNVDQVPMPEFWGGYRLIPDRYEFWEGRPSRLHDRIEYLLDAPSHTWRLQRLSP